MMRYTISLLLASAATFSPAWAEVPRVVTDLPPVQSIAAMVMGDLGSPVLLLDRGADAHDFQLRPSQAAGLAAADLVVWIGPQMTPWLDRALDGLSDSGARLELLDVPGTATRAFEGHDDHDHDEAGTDVPAAEADHAEEEGHEGHAHEGLDPHAWLDPANARTWAVAIGADLARLDPENAATYAANATAAAARIDTLDAEIAAQLAPAAGRPLVVFHDAYGYFADHYGLTIAGSIALGDAASPGAAHLKELRAGMKAGEVLCIFPETNHDPKLVMQMAEGTGARIGAALDPEGALMEPGPDLYGALLRSLATTIADCVASS